MSELLPSRQAAEIRKGLTDYLTTTFALSDPDAQIGLTRFLDDPETGIFRGPFVRARVPFRSADDGWRDTLDWYEGPVPYGHQAAAFRRLSSASHIPEPTLVVTGTGSGKTEAFLSPILDHVLRAKAAGDSGVKALILYPMNALANDQARRLADLIHGSATLRGVRAALYTGEHGDGGGRTRVTADGLITHRETIRDEPPDILLTNYKMLDQLLLRTADQGIITAMARGLTYLVLDEFHTYDGAQGTDVAMLLRRLGLALRRLRPADRLLPHDAADYALLDVTPVATSATLGDKGDPAEMLSFAETVFGRPFPPDSVVAETRQSVDEWIAGTLAAGTPHGGTPRETDNELVARLTAQPLDDADAVTITSAALTMLFKDGADVPWGTLSNGDLLASVAAHPVVRAIAEATDDAVSLDNLADSLFGSGLGTSETFAERRDSRRRALSMLIAALSHVRARVGRSALSIDLHLWVRELTRVDRAASPAVRFAWFDDGPSALLAADGDLTHWFPAVYCRHCGRSGWGIDLAPVGDDLASDDEAIRRNHAQHSSGSRFRALLHAPSEAAATSEARPVAGLAWFDPAERRVLRTDPGEAQAETALPVLWLVGDDVDDRSRDDECPACGRQDGIRFLGSAMATMLSVIVTTLFGDRQLDRAEKKALVFTDSVQDAAHRAGFVQSRAHVFALRNAIRRAVGDDAASLEQLVSLVIDKAGDDRDARYRLLAPELVEREEFAPFWQQKTLRSVPTGVHNRVKRRLLFDIELEFGLQSRVGRTLELTGSLAAGVDITSSKAVVIGRRVLAEANLADRLDGLDPVDSSEAAVERWVRGVVERMRERGAVEHEWLSKYLDEDGRRYRVWGGRPRGSGMPAFPPGREAPAFPRVGGHAPTGNDAHRTHLDVVSSSQSWFAVWARRVLHVTAAEGAALTRDLLTALEKDSVLRSRSIASGHATAYMLPASAVIVEPITLAQLRSGDTRLECDVCHSPVTGTTRVVAALADGPCVSARCPGTLRRSASDENYYRQLYEGGAMRRVVAREHTSLLPTEERLAYEDGFKSSDQNPSAANVLVATPTLEMGIDIGDLSAVMLAGIPRSIASYLQRVGRAGRLTGNALSVATVTGRGDQLPRMGDPLSVINGPVRPPATYLDAQEILQRQYVASLLDRRADRSDVLVRTAEDVLASSEPGSFLGDLVTDAEQHHAEQVDEFLAMLPALTATSVEMLRTFMAPTDGEGTSPLAAVVRNAVQRWNTQVDTLSHRRKEVADALPDLEAAAERAVEDDAKSALAAAKATHRLLGLQLKNLRTDYWVSALERFGLLPNYTLLDDTVTLDAAISWVDPDTSQWQDETYSFRRGAAVAISELAPGSFFYAQGLEIPIDAVDLGPGGIAVQQWAFCSTCGHSEQILAGATANTCPRCGTVGLNDVARRIPVVELESVSAIARRDEASISDRDDERRRTRFIVHPTVDLDPATITRQWFDDETTFGVTYARDLTIKWLNLGRQGMGGESRVISGAERTAPLFRVCDTCGQVDRQAGGNDRRDHRSWCPRRLDKVEHSISVALSRTLVTQGVFLRLPPAITLGDSLVIPSLAAALLRGLRELMGGDPDHLHVLQTVQPIGAPGETAEALLVHDAVPGGTGYLAELADPDRMHELLVTAWRVVRDCTCRTEHRAACHLCLLPYAAGDTSKVSRASAEQSLAKLLRVLDGEPQPFDYTEQDPGVEVTESVIEQLFRQRFIERVSALGGIAKEQPGDYGNRVQVTFPDDRRIWMLRPQVPLGFTTPDFVLEQFGGGADPIAIYTDGFQYHATTAHNRVADDAEKRAALRDAGYRVVAVTWQDLQDDASPLPDWFNPTAIRTVAPLYGIPLHQLERLTWDPLTSLMRWMQRPGDEAPVRASIARALPMMTTQTAQYTVSGDADSPLTAIAAAALRGHPLPGEAPTSWFSRYGGFASAGRLRLDQAGKADFALILDDGADAVERLDFHDDWRLWLHLSNLAVWRDSTDELTIAALSQVSALTDDSATASATSIGAVDFTSTPLTAEWSELAEQSTPAERAVLAELATAGVVEAPKLGVELGDGVPISFVWENRHVASAWDLTAHDRASLEAAGWVVVSPDAPSIIAALAAGRS